jgi:hypothetical protein
MSPEEKLLRAILGAALGEPPPLESFPHDPELSVEELWEGYAYGLGVKHLQNVRELAVSRAAFMAGMISMSMKIKSMTRLVQKGERERSSQLLTEMNADLQRVLKEIPPLLRVGRKDDA